MLKHSCSSLFSLCFSRRKKTRNLICRISLLLVELVIVAVALGVGLGVGLRSEGSSTERLVDAIRSENLMLHLRVINEEGGRVGYSPMRQYFTVPTYEQLNFSTFTAAVSNINYLWTFLEVYRLDLSHLYGTLARLECMTFLLVCMATYVTLFYKSMHNVHTTCIL